MTEAPIVETVKINKNYGAVRALRDVSISIEAGTVHALVGENGAGKSTVGKIIGGATDASGGRLFLDGAEVHFTRPRDALAVGIAIVHQELALLPSRSVIDNVFLGIETRKRFAIAAREQRRTFDELASRWSFDIDPDTIVGRMSTGDQQKVEILRALARDARLIVMDEPTARLTAPETEQFHEIVRALRAQGKTVILVSHFLREVLELADTVTVMRDGEVIRTADASTETADSLIRAMLGADLDPNFTPTSERRHGEPPVLEARGLSGPRFRDVSLSVHPGEIVGIAGMVGSGRSELLRTIFGGERASGGEVILDGRALARRRRPRHTLARGIAMLPESRKDEGLLLKRSVRENIVLPHLKMVSRHGVLSAEREERLAGAMVEQLAIKCPGTGAGVNALSGGNQQKVVLAKCLLNKPRVLLLDEPTRGVDVGAKRAIYDLIREFARAGGAIVLVSSELDEVLGLADTVLVMRRGRMTAALSREQATEERVLAAAFGTTGDGHE